ncbi:O-antigen ligase family protein [Larkinella soli]|uniref:O-antigen ligase family protein n=1 Tax=Larkinella soli TaxID=1770527 RepID=UPI000FFC8575|nr:O-antigen ligase family protein [Larkinella soli]
MNALSNHLSNRRWFYSLLGVLAALGSGFLIGKFGLVASVAVVVLPVALALVLGVLIEPRLGLLIYVQLSFLIGFTRLLPVDAPVGIAIDAIVGLTLMSTFLNGKRMQWERLKKPAFFLILIWFIYNVLELFNPEAPYRPAWFLHIRSFSWNWLLVAIIVLVNPIQRKDIKILVNSWLFWSVLAAFWAFKQQYVGLTAGEQAWLDNGNAKTHVLFGQLRSFSFYSDAAQFGAEMAGVTLVSIIRIFEEKNWLSKALFFVLALVFFWGYAVSGTRSALFVLLAGFPFYLLLKRDFVKLLIGVCAALPLLFLLMYTSVGSSNYQVQRMRSAVTPMNDPSFLLRLENQRKIAAHLERLPFGAGIGTSADGGARFSPWHWAAQIAPDSWYVELWMETGRVGLTLYLCMLAAFIGVGAYHVLRLKDPWLVKIMFAFLAEFFGIAVMGYSNPVLGQFPTSSLIYIASILFTTCYRWDCRPDAAGREPVTA